MKNTISDYLFIYFTAITAHAHVLPVQVLLKRYFKLLVTLKTNALMCLTSFPGSFGFVLLFFCSSGSLRCKFAFTLRHFCDLMDTGSKRRNRIKVVTTRNVKQTSSLHYTGESIFLISIMFLLCYLSVFVESKLMLQKT